MSQEYKTIEAVIFDLDDTLIDWSNQRQPWTELNAPKVSQVYDYLLDNGHRPQLDRDTFVTTFGEFSEGEWQAAPDNEWRSPHFGAVLARTFRAAGVDPAAVDMRGAMEAYEWHVLPGVEIFPDTLPVLQKLRERGYKIGLVTNAYFPMWMRRLELETFGILEWLDAAITSGDTGWLKPHPAIYWRIMGLLDTMPDRSIFVGDSPRHDIAGANKTGLYSVLHAPPGLERERHGIEPDYEISALGELLPILEELG